MMRQRDISVLRAVLAYCILTLILLPGSVFAAKPDGNNGGRKSPEPKSEAPLSLVSESYYFRVSGENSCVGEDDQLAWSAAGSLEPGESFSYTPQVPGCINHLAAISVMATWDAGDLVLSSHAPDADLASLDAEQAGRYIEAPVVGTGAQLCMFPAYNHADVYYTVTLKNNSSETVHGIQVTGKSRNDWGIHYYQNCMNADADGDGWNDSLEHSMSNLLMPNNYIDGVFQPDILWGSNYLRSSARTLEFDDEIDSYPPDFNDDGIVDDVDLQTLYMWMGQGNGIPLENIDPNPGATGYHANALPWRRYDLDGNGFVGEEDLAIVELLSGLPVPMATDIVPPTARITSPEEGGSVPRGAYVMITAHAWDNASLSRVEYRVDGKTICSNTEPVSSSNNQSPLYYCWWETPKRSRDYTLEVMAVDGAGNSTISRAVQVRAR